MKYLIRVLVVVLTLILSTCLCYGIVIVGFNHMFKWADCIDDFDSYEKDFEEVALYVTDFFETKDFDEYGRKFLDVGYNRETKENTLVYNGEPLSLPSNIKTSYNVIKESAFNPGTENSLDLIGCYGDQIYFEGENGRYCLVYSADDKKPIFANRIGCYNNEIKFSVKKIKKHWYHVVNNP